MYIICFSKGLSAIQRPIKEGLLPRKRVGFIPTAGETYKDPYFVEESRQRLRLHGLDLIEVDVSHHDKQKLIDILESVDAVYVAGGNVFWLLQQLTKKGLVEYVQNKVTAGMPYFGESAGAVLLAPTIEVAISIDEPEDAPELISYEGLNLINFFPLPHVGKEKYKSLFDKLIEDHKDHVDIVQYTDEQAILIRNKSTYEIVGSSIEELKK
jgi:dipeptidase E